MAGRSAGQSLLENSYQLQTPDDSRAYYDALAETYDADFADALGYSYPRSVAAVYQREAGADDVPVLDVGCGTGIVAERLRLPPAVIDGVDISAEMLRLAAEKNLYRCLIAADLTQDLDAFDRGYGGAVSAGTFTHGHLGPEPLRPLLALMRSGGLFVIGVNERHFAAQGFAATLDRLRSEGLIGEWKTERCAIYAKSGHAHSNDHALILHYRKA